MKLEQILKKHQILLSNFTGQTFYKKNEISKSFAHRACAKNLENTNLFSDLKNKNKIIECYLKNNKSLISSKPVLKINDQLPDFQNSTSKEIKKFSTYQEFFDVTNNSEKDIIDNIKKFTNSNRKRLKSSSTSKSNVNNFDIFLNPKRKQSAGFLKHSLHKPQTNSKNKIKLIKRIHNKIKFLQMSLKKMNSTVIELEKGEEANEAISDKSQNKIEESKENSSIRSINSNLILKGIKSIENSKDKFFKFVLESNLKLRDPEMFDLDDIKTKDLKKIKKFFEDEGKKISKPSFFNENFESRDI